MRPDTFDAVIAGLEQAGFKSWRGGKGGRTFSTEVCHGGDSPRKLSIWPRSDGGFGATCFTAGCKGLELFNRIRHKAGIRPQGPPTASSTARNGAGRPPGTPPRPEKAATGRTGAAVGPSDADRRAYAMRVWEDSKAAAEDFPLPPSNSPARKWLRARNLWWESLGPPPMVRWCARLPSKGWPYGGPPPTSGALVVLLAPPSAWVLAWPDLPAPSAVQCVFVGPDGAPISLGKMTYGVRAGAVGLIGLPAPSIDGLIVCEGLADGLALAARRWETVAFTCTTPSASGPVLEYSKTWDAVTVYADADGPGRRPARQLLGVLKGRGVAAEAVQLRGFKDAAAYAEAGNEPLADLAAARADVLDLAAAHEADGLPRWEALRRAALTIAPPEAADSDGVGQDSEHEAAKPDAPSSPPPNDGPPTQAALGGMSAHHRYH